MGIHAEMVRKITEELANTRMDLSLIEWNNIATVLLGAAKRIDDLEATLIEAEAELRFVRVFVTSRERIKRPEGENLFDACVAKCKAVLLEESEHG